MLYTLYGSISHYDHLDDNYNCAQVMSIIYNGNSSNYVAMAAPKPRRNAERKDVIKNRDNEENIFLKADVISLRDLDGKEFIYYREFANNEYDDNYSSYDPPPSNIEILDSKVPNYNPQNLNLVAETVWRDGHEYAPANGIIPEDLQSGSSGNVNLLNRYFPHNRELLRLTDSDLLIKFHDLITLPYINNDLQSVAEAYYDRWVAGTGGDYFNQELSKYLLSNGHTIRTVLDFGELLNNKLKELDGNIYQLQFQSLKENFRAVYHEGEKTSGLVILINDTEKLYVYSLDDYTFDYNSNEWEGSFYFQIFDNFGLDNRDLIDKQSIYVFGMGQGFASWWILQHIRNFKPFRTEIRTIFKIKGDLDDAH